MAQTLTYLQFAGLQKSCEAWERTSKLGASRWYFIWLLIRMIPLYLRIISIKPPLRSNGSPPGDIIPISMIHQSCQLSPIFPAHVPTDWTPHNALDRTLLNTSASKYVYQTLWWGCIRVLILHIIALLCSWCLNERMWGQIRCTKHNYVSLIHV